jgi:hypothetical protein
MPLLHHAGRSASGAPLEAATVRVVFASRRDWLREKSTPVLRAEGVATKRDESIDDRNIYKLANNCMYVGPGAISVLLEQYHPDWNRGAIPG